MKLKIIVLVVLFLASTPIISAEEPSNTTACANCVDTPEWNIGLALGAGVITNPLSTEDDLLFPVVPKISFYGERFFLDNLTLGYTFLDSSNVKLDVTGKLNTDFFHFEGASNSFKAFAFLSDVTGGRGPGHLDPLLNIGDYKLRDRKPSYLLGPELTWRWDESKSMKFSAHKDVSSLHYGKQATIEFQYSNHLEDWYIEQRIGLTWKSKELNNYYYGIGFDETPEHFPDGLALSAPFRQNLTYTAKESLTPYLALNLNTPVSDNWTFLTSLKVEFLDSTITESPIVDSDHVISTFIGWGYAF